jgi:methylmalonyl-CoA/ethylmalonyl-CoA epimerase
MLKIKKIDHVALCVPSLDDAAAQWKALFGVEGGEREIVESQGTEVLPLRVGDSCVELIAPHGSASLARFLEKRGPGLHHVAFEVEGLDEAISVLKSLGVPLIDDVPRKGARGHRVVFVHPKATGGVLVELVEPERGEPPARAE